MRLLLIRPGALGDTLLTFPVIEALRTQSSNPHVILVGNKAVLPLARACGLVEEVFDYEDPLWSGLFVTPPSNLAGADLSHPPAAKIHSADEITPTNLRRDPIYRVHASSNDDTGKKNDAHKNIDKSSDVINQVSTTDKEPYSGGIGKGTSLHSILSGIDRAVAWLRDPDNIVYRNLQAAGIPQVTVVPGRPSPHEQMHIIDYLARSVGVSTNPQPCYGDCFPVANRLSGQEPAFAIHPGSGGARKCWPPERFAAVIRSLWQRGWPVLLLAGPADHERLEVLLKLLPTPPQPTSLKLLVDVPLLDLVPMLCQCRGYLGNDSGMTHLAALLGLPSLALFGPTDPLIWQPRGRVVSIIHEPDLEKLGVDRVIEYIESI